MTNAYSSSTKKLVVGGALLVIALCLPGVWWLLRLQETQDNGAEIIVFNNSSTPVRLKAPGVSTILSAKETWRSEPLGSGVHRVFIDERETVIETGMDGAGYLTPVSPVPLLVVDTAGFYANLSSGKMGRFSLVSTHQPNAVVKVKDRWTLSPFEKLPDSVIGAAPHRAVIVSRSAIEDEATATAAVERLNRR